MKHEVIERIRKSCILDDNAVLGVRACVGQGVRLDTKASNYDVIGMATTDSVDAEGDVILPGGCDWFANPDSYMRRNRKVFVDHWTDMGSMVGTIRNVKLLDGNPSGLQVRVGLSRACQFTELVAELAGSVGIGFSIGFIPTNYGPPTPEEAKKYPGARNIVRNWEWYELSFTAFPCNVSCQTQGVADVGGEYAKRAQLVLSTKSNPAARQMLKWKTLVLTAPRSLVLG